MGARAVRMEQSVLRQGGSTWADLETRRLMFHICKMAYALADVGILDPPGLYGQCTRYYIFRLCFRSSNARKQPTFLFQTPQGRCSASQDHCSSSAALLLKFPGCPLLQEYTAQLTATSSLF
ncbi:hypothetical protein HRR80_005151 [Exophiala dermatitidis]|uniref:Uncharacterized protein n=1 Tax=Exophiala dermatitidis TaxID=5970 RepID=A0AAN6IXX2_EXODE|nr:hypothetical protein HRR80_005151 [Exophiala dermatitidis]